MSENNDDEELSKNSIIVSLMFMNFFIDTWCCTSMATSIYRLANVPMRYNGTQYTFNRTS